jgi:hydroxymethylpyrimidine pyrophosphatase-like HAD family hydrolase
MANVLAMGDAQNDIGMLQLAGTAVAMGNAPDSVKEHADWVAPANVDRGVCAALARFL